LLSVAVLAAGCSGRGSISGKVYFKDQPLGGGTVVFTSADGQGSKVADIQPDGSYTIDAMPAGPVKIAVETESVRPARSGAGAPPGLPMPPPDKIPAGVDAKTVYSASRPVPRKYTAIPRDYADIAKSGLEYAVIQGPQQHDIRMK
jgi:hypothetical protein